MPLQVAIRHHTHYAYDRPVKISPQVIRLRPAPHARNIIRSYRLRITPEEHFINWQQDPYGNFLARVTVPNKTTELGVDVEVITEMVTVNPFDFFLEEYAENFPFTYETGLDKELTPYLEIVEDGPELLRWVDKFRGRSTEPTVSFLVAVNQALSSFINYNVRMEPGVLSCEETLGGQWGSCRDSAWVLVQLLRHLGLAARFVSGYLVQLVADEKPLDGPAGPETDFTDLHAWAEVYLPGAGWVGLDATSGLFAGEGHIPLAATPSPGSAAPISGYTEPCEVKFSYQNRVDRILETPRVTKPYSPGQWSDILRLGEKVDEFLADAKLTMGGEPTFVSADDMESEQWNEAADGTEKRRMGYDLAERLRAAFAPGGFLHFGEGKWYPGEALPRWQYAIYWRKDGFGCWQNASLFADPGETYGYTAADAEGYLRVVARLLGVPPAGAMPAYEDNFYYLWEAGNLPTDIDPTEIDPKNKGARRALSKLLETGLETPAGNILPLAWKAVEKEWTSGEWSFTRGKLFLLPGDSPIGFRLPLDRLPSTDPDEVETVVPASPLEERPALPRPEELAAIRLHRSRAESTDRVNNSASEPNRPLVKTALCVQARDGRLYVFLPPLPDLEPYLDLVATLEAACAETGCKVIIEGYHPPADPRLVKLAVTPDPGVIEVNIHPADSWAEMVTNYDILFRCARESRLDTNKYDLDGRHTGTGGGNHITLGGVTPADSPLLLRPDVLRSFVNFWQNHPGLSYLFSSPFVGPTSQAPRVDEGRPEMLYELEIAFRELDRHDDPPPWLVDRIFRNLLIDVTGNTHRAEFCIDKLYSPDSSSGRLGILEMRGFDMPPHREMCLVQLLLIRSLFAAFWQQPYRRPLIRWGTELHDRFLLHHYVREDLKAVTEYLDEAGIDFRMEWLDPFFAFRFPEIGRTSVGKMTIAIRSAIEPWNVLGEEMSNSGTARFVDSSVERIEVSVEHFDPDRYQLLCNRVAVPLNNTPKRGTYVAGVRYKAWAPPSALHPTIKADVPLTFDIYDKWNERSVGGCVYHVTHPGGRSYATFPINSFEAEARRGNRFRENEHTPRSTELIVEQTGEESVLRYVGTEYVPPAAAIRVMPAVIHPDFPHTVDLRSVGEK